MKYIDLLVCISIFAFGQAALGADGLNCSASDLYKLAQAGPLPGTEFNLAETINEHSQNEVLPEAKYLGYQASATKIGEDSKTLSVGGGPELKTHRRRDLDRSGLHCFDTVAADGTCGRVWIDLKSQRKVSFPKCYMYKTWAILAIAAEK
ncbi:MAG: hypothetical protein K2X27_17925 [Candidatus Obscuribacterales bacterium]|nr:hypothetical protein [Candidatus Obscuribacterales bacterium]